LIEGNAVLGVQRDNGIQVTAGAIVRNNIIIGFGKYYAILIAFFVGFDFKNTVESGT
jgi:hypothetical protein